MLNSPSMSSDQKTLDHLIGQVLCVKVTRSQELKARFKFKFKTSNPHKAFTLQTYWIVIQALQRFNLNTHKL